MTILAQEAIKKSLYPGAVAVDSTVGNGHDTLFLAKSIGEHGKVYGFDIQPAAISQTKARLKSCGNCADVELFLRSHEHMAERIPPELKGKIAAVMFNLGYLPQGNKEIVTTSKSTLAALDYSLSLLSTGGTLSVVAYPGHPGGDQETRQVIDWSQSLDLGRFFLERVNSHSPAGPILIIVRRL